MNDDKDKESKEEKKLRHKEKRILKQKEKHPHVRNELKKGWELHCPGCSDKCEVLGYRHDKPPPDYDHGFICNDCAKTEAKEEREHDPTNKGKGW